MTVDAPARATDDVREARAWLATAAEPGNPDLWRFVAAVGPVEAAIRLRSTGAPARLAALLGDRRDRSLAEGERILEQTERARARLVVPEDEEWPVARFELDALYAEHAVITDPGQAETVPVPPLALWVRGRNQLASITRKAVAVIGARACTAYGEEVASAVGRDLARADRPVVTGGGYGVEQAAVRGALAERGLTVVVQPGGVDRSYPAAHSPLLDSVADGNGLVVSEQAPGVAPMQHRARARGRLLAMLSFGVVVVEAAARSSVGDVVRPALLLNRPVMAFPGPVTSELSAGCHQLLVDGRARLVTSGAGALDYIAGRIP